MKITKKTIKAVIQSMKSSGASAQDIEDNFKAGDGVFHRRKSA